MNFILEMIRLSVKKNFAYRINFVMLVLDECLDIIGVFLLWLSFFSMQINLGNWGNKQLYIFVGFSLISSAISNLFVGVSDLPDYILDGTLDIYLVRPKHALLLIAAERYNFFRFVITFPIGVIIGVWQINVDEILLYLYALLICILASFALELILTILYVLTFWLKNSSILVNFTSLLFSAKKYPLHYFKSGVMKVLTFVLPVAFVATIPTEMTANTGYIVKSIYMFFFCFVIFLVLRVLWKKGVKVYESAN